jgi:SAP domain
MADEARVGHGPLDEDVANSLTPEEKAWLRSWNRGDEIPGGDEETEAPDADAAYEDYTNDQLRAELSERGLPLSGNKAELIERLEEDDASAE